MAFSQGFDVINQCVTTVAIVTYNRAKYLRETLQALSKLNYPAESWELIVVDNNSSDETRAVVESFSSSRPTPRYLFEGNQGLGYGRNRAIQTAAGKYVVFADDDILMEPNWLSELIAPFIADAAATIGAIGGEVIPVFPDGLPPWLEGAHRPLNYRSNAGPLPPNQMPMGANFAFRSDSLQKTGPFRTDLGRKGARLFGGEDTELVTRIRAAGYAVWFSPRAKVQHQIPSSRLNFSYASRHAYDSARSRVMEKIAALNNSSHSKWGFILSRIAINLLKSFALVTWAAFNALILRWGDAKKALTRAWRCFGYIDQCLRSFF